MNSIKKQFAETYNDLIKKLSNIFSKKNLIFIGIFIIVGLLIHAELIIREVSNPDSIASGYVRDVGEREVSLGRWLLVILSNIRFNFSTPLISTFLAIVITNISTLFIIDLFNIKKNISKILLAVFLLSTPAFVGTLSFFYCSSEYALSMLLSILIPWCAFKIENKKYSIILASVFLCLSMAIYQSYIGVAIGTYLIKIIQQLFNSKKDTYNVKKVLKDIFYIFLIILIGFALYAVTSEIALKILKTETSNFRGANNVSIINSIVNFPQSIFNAYKDFINLFFSKQILRNSVYYRQFINAVLFIEIFVIITWKNIKERKYTEYIIQIILLLLLPLAFNIIVFIATGETVRVMMAHGMFMIFVLLMTLLDNYKIKVINCISIIFLIILIETYIISMNATYVSWSLTKNQTLTVTENILEEIEQSDLYRKNAKICIIDRVDINKTNPIYKMTLCDLSEYGFFWPIAYQPKSWISILNNYFGYEFNFVTREEYDRIKYGEDFKNMEKFTNESSIKVINNTIVVKLR